MKSWDQIHSKWVCWSQIWVCRNRKWRSSGYHVWTWTPLLTSTSNATPIRLSDDDAKGRIRPRTWRAEFAILWWDAGHTSLFRTGLLIRFTFSASWLIRLPAQPRFHIWTWAFFFRPHQRLYWLWSEDGDFAIFFTHSNSCCKVFSLQHSGRRSRISTVIDINTGWGVERMFFIYYTLIISSWHLQGGEIVASMVTDDDYAAQVYLCLWDTQDH